MVGDWGGVGGIGPPPRQEKTPHQWETGRLLGMQNRFIPFPRKIRSGFGTARVLEM